MLQETMPGVMEDSWSFFQLVSALELIPHKMKELIAVPFQSVLNANRVLSATSKGRSTRERQRLKF